jgi:hypothetical protein
MQPGHSTVVELLQMMPSHVMSQLFFTEARQGYLTVADSFIETASFHQISMSFGTTSA